MMKTKTKLSNLEMGFFLALLSAFFFSLNIPVTKSLLSFISPYWLASLLYFGAGFVIYGGSLIFYVFAQRSLGAAKVQMIQSFSPLMGGIFAWLIFQEPITVATVVGYLFVVMALILIGFDLFKDNPTKG
jgi:drug/metabolite transporter (DMT)-like permease